MESSGGVLAPLKEQLMGSGFQLPLASLLGSNVAIPTTRGPSPPPGSILPSPGRVSAFEMLANISLGKDDDISATNPTENARATSPPPAGLSSTPSPYMASSQSSPAETPKTTQTSDTMVPSQLSAFPLFGGKGVPQAQAVPQESAEEDIAAWQPFFAPSVPPSPRSAGLMALPGMGFAMFPSPAANAALFGASPLLSPRGMIPDGMLEAIALDVGRTTLIPRLNLDAIHQQTIGSMPPPSQFPVPATPSTLPSSGRISRLATPSGSVSSAGGRSTSNVAGQSATTSPRGQRVQSTFSARESALLDEPLTSPVSSARGKRRRSIYDDDEEMEFDEGEFVGTYVPTVSSARQKKKRALAENAALQASR